MEAQTMEALTTMLDYFLILQIAGVVMLGVITAAIARMTVIQTKNSRLIEWHLVAIHKEMLQMNSGVRLP